MVMSVFERSQMYQSIGERIHLKPSPFGCKASIQSCGVEEAEGRKRKERWEGWKAVEEGFKLEADFELSLGNDGLSS